ncbi:MAG TPA: hypothetical protein P5222_08675 [Candidatus Cloacimonadota bacterium]|nr:hypothetical protein [Candidatus Cloacimonadota bacterium]HOR58616.1 hypothetical protein [Candidatus Cloacimonadota bacterium]HRS50757.1 hypothetical protein [Candidatus Cloacimonadota bacterium]
MSWAIKVRALQSLSEEIPNARIELTAELCEAQVQQTLGAEAYSGLAGDPRLEYAICALCISKLILTSRAINEASSIHRTEGWGDGNIHPSEVTEMINLSKRWEAEGEQVVKQLRAELPSSIGWIDI